MAYKPLGDVVVIMVKSLTGKNVLFQVVRISFEIMNDNDTRFLYFQVNDLNVSII